MGVLFRSALAGIINEEMDFLCFKCMPHKIVLTKETIPIFWSDFEDGEVLDAECDKCKKEITASDEPEYTPLENQEPVEVSVH